MANKRQTRRTPDSIPPPFDPDQEPDKFLAKIKKKAATNFSWKKQDCLQNAARLAYWLYVYGKEDQALEVCRFLGQYEFAGNFSLWSWVERTLVLQSRLVRQRGQNDESAQCLERIKTAGFVENRLNGILLSGHLENIEDAAAEKDKTRERDWSLTALGELCVMIELGGSDTWPVATLEKQFQEILERLRILLKVPVE